MPRIPLPSTLRSGPFTLDEGHGCGVSTKRMRGRDLRRPFRGVRAASDPTTIEELARAFQRGALDDTVLCGITAAALLGVPLPARHARSRLLHVAVPSPNRSPKARGTVGHKLQLDADAIRDWHGIRVTSPERTWCDLATVLSVPDLVAAGDFLIHWEHPLTNDRSLRAAVLGWRGHRGVRKLRVAIELLNNRSESRRESLLRVIVVSNGLRGVEANLPIVTSSGYHYRADLAFREPKVILEYQSRFHDVTKEFRADMTRISRLEVDGWYVMQLNADDLRNENELVQRIRTVLASRSNSR